MRIDVVSIFPGMFEEPLSTSMLGMARESGRLEVRLHDLRDWTADRHRQVDDTPYGGGPGMVMKPEPFFRAVEDLNADGGATVVLMTPQGRRFDQHGAVSLASADRLVILCGALSAR